MWSVVIFEPLLDGEGCEGDQLATQVHAVVGPFESDFKAEEWLQLWQNKHAQCRAPAKAEFTYLITPMEVPANLL